MTTQERIDTLNRAIGILAEIEVRAKYSDSMAQVLKLIRLTGEDILKDANQTPPQN